MDRAMRWHDHVTINLYWLGLNVAAGTITPLLLPYLVAMFVPEGLKNTYLASIRVISLAVAMVVQPIAGLLSDRCTSRWGRRRPYVLGGTILNLLFLVVVGISPLFLGAGSDGFLQPALGVGTAYAVLLAGIVLLQASSNLAHGALQGLIPDLVPEDQRGKSSGVKTLFELVLPGFLVLFVGPLMDRGWTWAVVGVIMAAFVVTMLPTILLVREEPLRERPARPVAGPILRLVALTAVFVAVTRGAVWLVSSSGTLLVERGASVAMQVAVVGLAGLVGMAGSIFLGVYLGAWVGIGREAPRRTSFIWWVVNRLLFLAAVNSLQAFSLYFLADVLRLENAASAATWLRVAVAVFLVPSALWGGHLADRIGRRRLVAISALIASGGTFLLLFSNSFALVIVSGCIVGVGTGAFWTANWALGTDLAPSEGAGHYLGISNLAGAGAGIVGTGIGGPMADFFNALQPGLGYLVIFAIYGALILLSVAALARVRGVAHNT